LLLDEKKHKEPYILPSPEKNRRQRALYFAVGKKKQMAKGPMFLPPAEKTRQQRALFFAVSWEKTDGKAITATMCLLCPQQANDKGLKHSLL
jgi:hypothetical protein